MNPTGDLLMMSFQNSPLLLAIILNSDRHLSDRDVKTVDDVVYEQTDDYDDQHVLQNQRPKPGLHVAYDCQNVDTFCAELQREESLVAV